MTPHHACSYTCITNIISHSAPATTNQTIKCNKLTRNVWQTEICLTCLPPLDFYRPIYQYHRQPVSSSRLIEKQIGQRRIIIRSNGCMLCSLDNHPQQNDDRNCSTPPRRRMPSGRRNNPNNMIIWLFINVKPAKPPLCVCIHKISSIAIRFARMSVSFVCLYFHIFCFIFCIRSRPFAPFVLCVLDVRITRWYNQNRRCAWHKMKWNKWIDRRMVCNGL